MSKRAGVLLVSHVHEITEGLHSLLNQVAKDVTIKTAGGTEENEVGTSFDKISQALAEFEEDIVFAFYDLGSAKMNMEIAAESVDKDIRLYDTAFLEGAYIAASLLQADVDLERIDEQLQPLIIKHK